MGLMERKYRNTNGQHRLSSMPGDDLGNNQVTETVSAIGNYGFPKRTRLNDDPLHDGSEDFVPHIITRMPNLTGYGHDTAPQSISLSQPKSDRRTFLAGHLKKLPLHHWKYAAAVAVVVAILAWSFIREPGSHQVAQNTQPDSPNAEKVQDTAKDRKSSTRESNNLQFDGFPPIPTSSTSSDTPMFFNGTTTSQAPQSQYFGTGIAEYSSGTAQVTTVPPDVAPARDLAPWERQPNNVQPNHTMATMTPTSPQFDFTGNVALPMTASAGTALANNNVAANNVPNSTWPDYHSNVGTPQWSNQSQTYSGIPGNTPYIAQQNSYQQNTYQANIPPQNVPYQPASPQQGYYQQHPAGNDHAIAMNTANMSSYPQGQMQQGQGQAQGQGQWPPQNPGNMMNNDPFPQQSYSGNGPQYTAGSQYAPHNNMQFAPQQQQQFPYSNMAVSPPQETTYR